MCVRAPVSGALAEPADNYKWSYVACLVSQPSSVATKGLRVCGNKKKRKGRKLHHHSPTKHKNAELIERLTKHADRVDPSTDRHPELQRPYSKNFLF